MRFHDGLYVLAAVIVPCEYADQHRAALRALLLGKQPRLHWRDERPKRRLEITHAVAALRPNTVIVIGTHLMPAKQRRARRKCLERLLWHLACRDVRMPGEGRELARADAVIAALMTFNTINKWALGITGNFAIGLLCELTGYGVPIVAVPMLKPALARHLAFQNSLHALRQMGVTLMFDPSAPYDRRMPTWDDVLSELDRTRAAHPPRAGSPRNLRDTVTGMRYSRWRSGISRPRMPGRRFLGRSPHNSPDQRSAV
ncbi:hypothetical protein GCM10009734_07480 [Nonomuraea bangladeshensis]